MEIKSLELIIGKVVFKDYSKGAKPSVQEFKINLDEKFKNIRKPSTIITLIVVKSLMNTTIAGLTNFDLKGLQGTVSGTLSTAQKVAGAAAGQATKVVGSTAKTATDTLKNTTGGITGALNPFSGAKKE